MAEREDKVVLIADDGSEDAFFVVEKAEIAGRTYLLVSDKPSDSEEDSECLILKEEFVDDNSGEIVYDIVDDENELSIISKYFEELIEDIDITE
ncbi:DUF1292 domain-containing protein [Eubacterium xylanophilum]|uniref:DUF1292 domain-containing protein n=1 Tax=Eubacterium xylanophilum TaxID=39497 RepID=UPI00047C08F9|nr:DUF1292 domain-containing protein [Eubacterium xylanophilum]